MKTYFQEGVGYLIAGVHQSLIDLERSYEDLEEDQKEVLDLTDQLKAKIDFFYSCHVKGNKKVQTEPRQPEINTNATEDRLTIREGYARYQELQGELWLERRRNKNTVNANRRLKNKIRRLRVSIRRLNSQIGGRVVSVASKLQKKINSLSYELNSDLSRSRMLITKTAQHYDQNQQKSINSLVMRLRTCVSNTEAIKQQSDRISTMIEEVPGNVRETLGLDRSFTDQQTLLTRLSESLQASRREAGDYARVAGEEMDKRFESMLEGLAGTLGTAEQLKRECLGVIDRVEEGCRIVCEKVEQDCHHVSNQIQRMFNLLENLNKMINPILIEKRRRREAQEILDEALKEEEAILRSLRCLEFTLNMVKTETRRKKDDRFCSRSNSIGPYIALKNLESYLICMKFRGLLLIEQKKELKFKCHSSIPGRYQYKINDMIYITHLNCYLLIIGSKLYKKEIDDEPMTLIWDFSSKKPKQQISHTLN